MKNNHVKSFKDLLVWQKSHGLVKQIYRLSEKFPRSEQYALTSQLRRAAVSIPANIAEGFGRNTLKDKMRFLTISKGSLEECRYYLILANEIEYGETEFLMNELDEVCKLLNYSLKTLSEREKNKY